MRVQFVHRGSGPERLACDAEIVFDDGGPLDGMKLVGFSLWRGPDGETFVTFPARAFGVGTDRRFFDLLRPVEGPSPEQVKRVKSWILDQYRSQPAS